jgi:outer membrane receptor protein involved in Fe transport
MVRKDLISRYVALALTGAASTVMAQTAPVADASGSTELQEIVVTGSMIKRPNAETAEAVTIVKAETLKDMGITSVEQALAQLTSNISGVTTQSSVSSFSGGASFASLRGLGGSKTLVLLDGQRLANNVIFGNAVDLNTIPFSAIDHIEVLREGASSLYGSDAIAGVINFITKKDYDKGEISVQVAHPQGNGDGTGDFELTWGHGNLAADAKIIFGHRVRSGGKPGQPEWTDGNMAGELSTADCRRQPQRQYLPDGISGLRGQPVFDPLTGKLLVRVLGSSGPDSEVKRRIRVDRLHEDAAGQ